MAKSTDRVRREADEQHTIKTCTHHVIKGIIANAHLCQRQPFHAPIHCINPLFPLHIVPAHPAFPPLIPIHPRLPPTPSDRHARTTQNAALQRSRDLREAVLERLVVLVQGVFGEAVCVSAMFADDSYDHSYVRRSPDHEGNKEGTEEEHLRRCLGGFQERRLAGNALDALSSLVLFPNESQRSSFTHGRSQTVPHHTTTHPLLQPPIGPSQRDDFGVVYKQRGSAAVAEERNDNGNKAHIRLSTATSPPSKHP